MSYQTILTTLANNILTITINRPDKMNALNKTVITELSAAIEEVYQNKEIKAAIITGSGSKAFVAGADISEFQNLSVEQAKQLAQVGQDLFFKIEKSPKPVVAAVNGFALGGGCELALACHFIYASENAKFGQPEVNLGLIPGYGGTQRLVSAIGKRKAMEWIMSAKLYTAAEAAKAGLVNEVCTAEELLPQLTESLTLILTKAPVAISYVIQAVNGYTGEKKGFDLEVELFGKCFGTKDKQEGTSAFLEKRKPDFTGE